MLTPSDQMKLETVKKLIRRNARAHLENLLLKLHPADIATIIKNLNEIDRKKIWGYLTGKPIIGDVILEFDDSQIIEFFSQITPKEIASILNEMETDDAANILRLIDDEERVKEIIQYMKKDEAGIVGQLLQYPDDSAGSIMNPNFYALHEDVTVKEATKVLHKAEDLEMVFYLYVIDSEGRLVGVISLRQLILNPPEKLLKEIMARDVIKVTVKTDKEEVAKIVERYDLLAVPVVDEQNKLVGIITVDDIIDVIRDETTEDIYKMAGTTENELVLGNKSISIAKVRLPWLLVTFFGELISGLVITFFHGKVRDFAILASFMPLICAMGGNVGSQSATILIRGMALGKILQGDLFKVILKEIRVGIIMGIILGIIISFIAPLWGLNVKLGIIVGISMFSAVTLAAFTGTCVPAALIKLKFDPAIASSPFISTLNDITGLTIYFLIAITLMQFLL